jgi:hypothetical protein
MSSCLYSQTPAYNQDLFTIVPSEQYASSYATDGPCRSPTIQGSWAPEPEKVLDVKLEGPNGAVSEIGWPACCTSTSVPPIHPELTCRYRPQVHPPKRCPTLHSHNLPNPTSPRQYLFFTHLIHHPFQPRSKLYSKVHPRSSIHGINV